MGYSEIFHTLEKDIDRGQDRVIYSFPTYAIFCVSITVMIMTSEHVPVNNCRGIHLACDILVVERSIQRHIPWSCVRNTSSAYNNGLWMVYGQSVLNGLPIKNH